jgi:hypothetical protein
MMNKESRMTFMGVAIVDLSDVISYRGNMFLFRRHILFIPLLDVAEPWWESQETDNISTEYAHIQDCCSKNEGDCYAS